MNNLPTIVTLAQSIADACVAETEMRRERVQQRLLTAVAGSRPLALDLGDELGEELVRLRSLAEQARELPQAVWNAVLDDRSTNEPLDALFAIADELLGEYFAAARRDAR